MKNIVLFIVILFSLSGCFQKGQESQKKDIIVTSTFALYDATSFIAQDDFKVVQLLPFGREIHDFEPTPKDLIAIEKAKLFFYSGAGLEPWTKRFAKDKGVDMSRYVTLLKVGNTTDPHYWLDPLNMQKVADAIATKLTMLQPNKKEQFLKRAKEYKVALHELDALFHDRLQKCKNRAIYVNHNAYNYLAKRYGFRVEALMQLSPEASPSPKEVANIIKLIRNKRVKILFKEPFESSAVLEMVARETKTKIDVLQPLANITAQEAKEHKSYVDIMKENLLKIQKALGCEV